MRIPAVDGHFPVLWCLFVFRGSAAGRPRVGSAFNRVILQFRKKWVFFRKKLAYIIKKEYLCGVFVQLVVERDEMGVGSA